MRVDFVVGSPTFVLGLGLLPGPIRTVVLDGELLIVDDRSPGEDLSIGNQRARTVTHDEAVRVVLSLASEPADSESRSVSTRHDKDAPVSHGDSEKAAPRQWLSTLEAAELLGVNRKTLDTLARGNLDVPGGPVAVGGKTRVHLRWPPTGLQDWMVAVRERAEATVAKPKRRAPPRRAPADDDAPTDWSKVRKRLLRGE